MFVIIFPLLTGLPCPYSADVLVPITHQPLWQHDEIVVSPAHNLYQPQHQIYCIISKHDLAVFYEVSRCARVQDFPSTAHRHCYLHLDLQDELVSWQLGGRGGLLNRLEMLLGKVRENGEALPFYTEREND